MFVANDPYHGGGHLPDYNVFAPVFADAPDGGPRRMVLIASIQCHHGDTGGGVPGGYNITADRHLGRGRALAGREGHRPRRRAPRRALRAAGQQPHPELHRRPARADRLRAARRAAARRDHRALRRGDRRGERRLDDRLRGPPLPRRGRAVARRRVRGRRVRRPRPARQPRRAPAREGHRRRRRAHDRLHRLRHAARAPGVVDLRQHPRLHGRPDRRDDGSRDPEERRASSSRSSSSCPRAACSTPIRASR